MDINGEYFCMRAVWQLKALEASTWMTASACERLKCWCIVCMAATHHRDQHIHVAELVLLLLAIDLIKMYWMRLRSGIVRLTDC